MANDYLLDYHGLEKVAEKINNKEPLVFKGTQAEWNALTEDEQALFTVRYHPDEATGDVTDAVTDGDLRAVTSNAVYDGLCKSKSITVTKTSDWISGSISVKQIGRIVTVTISGGSWNYNNADTVFATGLPKPVLNYYELALNVAGDTCTVIVDTQGRLLGGLSRGVNVWHSLVYITTE